MDGWIDERMRLSLRSPDLQKVQQPETLNEIFKASVFSAVRLSRQTLGLHDVRPKPQSSRPPIGPRWPGVVRCLVPLWPFKAL